MLLTDQVHLFLTALFWKMLTNFISKDKNRSLYDTGSNEFEYNRFSSELDIN